MNKLENTCVSYDTTLRNALALLDKNEFKILLLLAPDGKLERTVTDGDIRRLLLSGTDLDGSLLSLPESEPIVVSIDESESRVLNLMDTHQVNHIPVIGAGEIVEDIYLRSNIQTRIQLSIPHMGSFERQYVEEAFDTNWIAPLGPNVDAFEVELAAEVGIGHAAAVNSGTAAIHLALVLLDVKQGDIVFCSSYTFAASANPILYQGATPVFIDADLETWNMSPQALERALLNAESTGQLPKAVIVVNIYGQSADMDVILDLCDRYEIPVIEDAAESLGATYKGKASGTLAHIGIYSFNGNKIITTSGGGMLVSNDGELVEKARFLATQARDNAPYYLHTQLGYNYRMSNVLAGIGRGQLRVLHERVNQRRTIFSRYEKGLSDIPGLSFMPEASYGRGNRWLSCCLLDSNRNNSTLDSLLSKLAQKSIEARYSWRPMHRQPIYNGAKYFEHEEGNSVSDLLFNNVLCLPSASSMTEQEQERVIETIRIELLENKRDE